MPKKATLPLTKKVQPPVPKPAMMSRADSLKSLSTYGRIISPAVQPGVQAKKKKNRIPILSDITDALEGK